MKTTIISSLILIAIIGACTNDPNLTDPPTPIIIPDTSYCAAADSNLANLCARDAAANSYCCQVDAPTKKGKTFTTFCQDKQTEDAGVFLNPKCLSTITSCDQIDVCTNSK